MDLADALEDVLGGNEEQQEVKIWLDTGFPPLNKIISGDYRNGMPVGRMIEIFSPPSCGKTAIATMLMVGAQQAGGVAFFNDHEHSFDVGLAVGFGLDTTPGKWVYRKPRTYEKSLDDTIRFCKVVREKKLIPDDAPICVVFDSLASMIPQSMLEDNKGKERDLESLNMNDSTALSRVTSTTFKVLALHADEMNLLILFLNQTRTKPGVTHGDATTTPGGTAMEFYAGVRLSLSREMIKDKADAANTLGQIVHATTKKNKVNRPFQKASWRFMFQADGTGKFDAAYSTIEHMRKVGAIEVSGAYNVWEGKKLYTSQLAELVEKDGLMPKLVDMLVAHEAAGTS
jgi:protein RecA